MTRNRAPVYRLEVETWAREGYGTERHEYRRQFPTLADVEQAYARVRTQLQRDFSSRFVELRVTFR